MSEKNLKNNLNEFVQGMKGVTGNIDTPRLQKLFALLEQAEKPNDERLANRLIALTSDFLNWVMGTSARDLRKNSKYFVNEAIELQRLL